MFISTEADTKPFIGCLWNGTCTIDDKDENGNKKEAVISSVQQCDTIQEATIDLRRNYS